MSITINKFFQQVPYDDWSIEAYLDYNHDAASDRSILNLYSTSLNKILNNPSRFPTAQVDKARALQTRYTKSGTRQDPSDKELGRKWLKNRQGPSDASKKKHKVNKSKKPKRKQWTAAGLRLDMRHVFNGPVFTGPVQNAVYNAARDEQRLDQDGREREASTSKRPPPQEDEGSVIEHGDEDNEGSVAEEDESTVVEGSPEPHKGESITGITLAQIRDQYCMQFEAMQNKFTFKTGRVLEDVLYRYTIREEIVHPGHLWVLTRNMRRLFDDEEWEELLGGVLPIPSVPESLVRCIHKYDDAATVDDFRKIAEACIDPSTSKRYTEEENPDEHWLETVIIPHMLRLLTKTGNLLLDPRLLEGVFDSAVYPPFLDQYVWDLDSLLLQRKDSTFLALECSPDIFGEARPRFDAIFRSRCKRQHEYALIEVSAQARKNNSKTPASTSPPHKDTTKMVRGLCAMLRVQKEIVKREIDTVQKLRVVGLLQQGLSSQFLVMSCLNENVYFLSEGKEHEIPTTVASLKDVFPLVASICKFKHMVRASAQIVEEQARQNQSHGDWETASFI